MSIVRIVLSYRRPGRSCSGAAGLIQPPKVPGDGGDGSWLTLAALVGVLIGRRRTRRGAVAAAMATEPQPDPEPNRTAQQPMNQVATEPVGGSQSGSRRIEPLTP